MSSKQELVDAIGAGDAARIERLLRADPALARAYTDDGWSTLHLASSRGIAELLIAYGADVRARNRHKVYGPGNSPLHAAVYNQKRDVAALLIARGADVDATDDYGWTPLHLAAANNCIELAELLLANGADANLRTARKTPDGHPQDSTPLAIAEQHGYQELARLIRQRSASASG